MRLLSSPSPALKFLPLPLLFLAQHSLAQVVPVPFPATPRLVVAHFMVGNTFTYSVDDWVHDIILASSKGIDGFALNIGQDSWEVDRVRDAFDAAARVFNASFPDSTSSTSSPLISNADTDTDTDVPPPTGFNLFLSFDMSSFPCSAAQDTDAMHAYLNSFASHPRYLLYPPLPLADPSATQRPLVSTFAGEACAFGQGSVLQGWARFLRDAKGEGAGVHFVPAFFSADLDGSGVERYAGVEDGDFNWNSAWPMDNSSITPDTDYAHLRYLKAKTYMAGVSPWFFTHYPPSTFNKNWLYRADDHLPARRWEQLVANRAYVDIAQIISWNDYGESHYVGPVKGEMPGGAGWVRGMEHTGWLDLMQYYIAAYKTGTYPAIVKDQIILWGRVHPALVDDPYDSLEKPDHYDWTEDNIYALLLLSQPAHISLSCGPSNLSAELPAGASKVVLPLTPARLAYLNAQDLAACNVTALVQSLDRGTTLLDFVPEGFVWRARYAEGEGYNFNAFVAASP